MGSHLVTIVPSTRTWDWVNSIQHLGMKKYSFHYMMMSPICLRKHKLMIITNTYKRAGFLLRSTVSVSLLFQWLVLRFRRLGTTHFDHWPNLKKVGWLFNWQHFQSSARMMFILLVDGSHSRSYYGLVTCLNWNIVMQPSRLHLFTTSFYGGLEIWIQNGRRP